jgi:hypothetical protein
MPGLIQIKPLKPNVWHTGEIRLELLNALRKSNTKTLQAFKRTTATWQRPPKWEKQISLAGGKAMARVFTESDIYRFIDEGTKIRWALMSSRPPWQSKTAPYRLDSGPGRGHVVLAGRRAFARHGLGPRPGIAARHFSRTIRRMLEKEFPPDMQEAINRGLEKAGCGGPGAR